MPRFDFPAFASPVCSRHHSWSASAHNPPDDHRHRGGRHLLGAGDNHHRAEAASKRPKAWFDAKGDFVFPLGKEPFPATRDEVGRRSHARLEDEPAIPRRRRNRQLDRRQIPRPSATSNLRLGGGIMKNTDRDQKGTRRSNPAALSITRVAVRNFDLDARPLVCDKAGNGHPRHRDRRPIRHRAAM